MKIRPSIAIIDDDSDSRDTFAGSAQLAGFKPCIFEGRYRSEDALLADARKNKVKFALCDHILSDAHYARFTGAKAVARFYDSGIPAVLVTHFLQSEVESSIRPFRRKIPQLISSSQVSPQRLREALEACRQEIVEHKIPLERRGCRAVLTVKELVPGPNETVVKVRITQWSTTEFAGFPLSMIPLAIRKSVKPEAFLFATVNTGADSSADLFFEDFELPHPDDAEATRTQFGSR